MDATARSLNAPVAAAFFVINAKNENSIKFFRGNGFRSYADQSNKLFLPFADAKEALLGKSGK
jgi:hypothetical protein